MIKNVSFKAVFKHFFHIFFFIFEKFRLKNSLKKILYTEENSVKLKNFVKLTIYTEKNFIKLFKTAFNTFI